MGGGLKLEDRVDATMAEAAGAAAGMNQPLEAKALKEFRDYLRNGKETEEARKLRTLNDCLLIADLYNSGIKTKVIIERFKEHYQKMGLERTISKSTIYKRLNEFEDAGFYLKWKSKNRAETAKEKFLLRRQELALIEQKRQQTERERDRERLAQQMAISKQYRGVPEMVKCFYNKWEYALWRIGNWFSPKKPAYAVVRAYNR